MRRTALGLCLTIAFTNPNVNAIVCAEAPEQTIQSLLAEARAAQTRGDFRTAADAYREATELDPSIPELWANLGLMEREIGKSSDAIQCFKNAIRLNPRGCPGDRWR
jgi:tetratricopeptide (TPR) repeat protein